MPCCNDPSRNATSVQQLQEITRRQLFRDCGLGLGKIALASLLCDGLASASAAEAVHLQRPHFAPKAKRVIYLFMVGAPSQLDLYDYKPELVKHDGKPVPSEFTKDLRYAFIQKDAALLSPRFKFAKHGKSGQELSEVLPHLAKVADDIAIVRSVHTDHFNHAPAQIFVNTGSGILGRPSMGAWITYGLGSEASDLPGFVVLTSGGGTSGGPSMWGSGFLPTQYQATRFQASGSPVLAVSNPPGVGPELQRQSLDLIRNLNQKRLDTVGDPEIATRISAFEMAYRMQTSCPALMDLSKESPATLAMYGAKPGESSFANNCLLARRLIERGVRFVNVYHADWDHHTDVAGGLKNQCKQTDQAGAALIADLKQRGLLEDTLVIWGGEFGRTPMVESSAQLNRSNGRDHHPQAYSMWLAGGGVKAGLTLGKTDDIGFNPVEDPVHVHDLQATILHLLGLDHKRLTYHHQGRDYRLTDVHGEVVAKLLA